MKLKIKTLPFGTHAVECHLDESFFNTDEQIEVRRADVDVTLTVTRKSESTFRLEISCRGTVTTACDRCLEDLDLPVDVDYRLNVEQMGTELDDSNDELLIVPSDWRELDAAPIVRDTVLLAIPMTHCHENEDDCNAAYDEFKADKDAKKFSFADYSMKVEYDEYCIAQLVLNLKKDQGVSLKKSASLKSDSENFAKGIVRLILAGLK